jgi:hypothetical protein
MGKWKTPSTWQEVITSGTIVLFTGHGEANGTQIGMSILVPVALIDNTERYWQVADAYNTGNIMTHFQVKVSKNIFQCSLFYGSSGIQQPYYNVYYQ